jgi:hypothetical protein
MEIFENITVTGVLVAVIVGLIKGLEWLLKKYNEKNGNGPEAEHKEHSRKLCEMHDRMLLMERDMKDVKGSTDKIADAMARIADCIEKTSQSNAKVAELVEKIDRRMDIQDAVAVERERRRASNE